MNKCFTYKGFDEIEAAFEYAKKAMKADASYVEIMIASPRFKHMEKPIIVQHNSKRWIR